MTDIIHKPTRSEFKRMAAQREIRYRRDEP